MTAVCGMMDYVKEIYRQMDSEIEAEVSAVAEIPEVDPRLNQTLSGTTAASETDWPTAVEMKPATPAEAKSFLGMFFANKPFFATQKAIPLSMLLDQRHIDMVLRLEMSTCIQAFHSALEDQHYGLESDDLLFVNIMDKKMADRAAMAQRPPLLADLDPTEAERYTAIMAERDKIHTKLFFDLQLEMRNLCIPKRHSGGLLLVWLRMCMGWDI